MQERIGHVMRIQDDSLTKVELLRWYNKLEGVREAPWKKRKTVLYWNRITNEAVGVNLNVYCLLLYKQSATYGDTVIYNCNPV